jgi:solute carrier family 25 (adenine nucleotide translocator) protein 4/5/6/31
MAQQPPQQNQPRPVGPPQHHAGNFLLDFTMGGLSAAISKTLVNPIERAKVIMQTQDINPRLAPYERSNNLSELFSKIVREEGVTGLFRGALINSVRYFPTQALNFAFKDTVKSTLCPYNPQREPIHFFIGNLLSGAVAGALSLLLVYPLDMARVRIMADIGRRQFDGVFDVWSKIIKRDGFFGLYSGFWPSVLGIFFYRAFYFGFYDVGKVVFKNSGFLVKFMFAQCVTLLSGWLTYPLDTIRLRLMMQAGETHKLYEDAFDVVDKMVTYEGVESLFSGALYNVIRGTFGAFVLVVYDEISQFIRKP